MIDIACPPCILGQISEMTLPHFWLFSLYKVVLHFKSMLWIIFKIAGWPGPVKPILVSKFGYILQFQKNLIYFPRLWSTKHKIPLKSNLDLRTYIIWFLSCMALLFWKPILLWLSMCTWFLTSQQSVESFIHHLLSKVQTF